MGSGIYTFTGFGLRYSDAAPKKIILGLNPGTRSIEVKGKKTLKQAIKDTLGSREVLIIVKPAAQYSVPKFSTQNGKPVAPEIISHPAETIVACNGVGIDAYNGVKAGATLKQVVATLEEDGNLESLLAALLPAGLFVCSSSDSIIIAADSKHISYTDEVSTFEVTLPEAIQAAEVLEPFAMQFHKMGLPLVSPRFSSVASWE